MKPGRGATNDPRPVKNDQSFVKNRKALRLLSALSVQIKTRRQAHARKRIAIAAMSALMLTVTAVRIPHGARPFWTTPPHP